MVHHAYRTVPYYRTTMDRLGLTPEDLATADDLARLPILERDTLQREPQTLMSSDYPATRCLAVRSGGSTGAPRTVYHNPAAVFQNAAHGERERSIMTAFLGRAAGYREAVLVSEFSTDEEVQAFIRRRTILPPGVAIRRRYFSILDPPEDNAPRLDAFRPDVMHGYGSYIGQLFHTMHQSGESFHRPRVVTYSSDPLPDSARRLITGTFGVPVLGTYQAVEAFKVGFECEADGGVHLNMDLYPLRLVDDDGHPVAEGGTGSVVVSNLVNHGMVLLNYRLGDLASWLPGPCPCGRSLPRLSMPEGRHDDWVVLPSGAHLHPQAVRTLFTDEEQIWQYQVVQETTTRFRVAVIAASGSDRARVHERLAVKFAQRFGRDVSAEIAFVEVIERTAAGKVRPFIGLGGGQVTE